MPWPKGKKRPRKSKILEVRPEVKAEIAMEWPAAVQQTPANPQFARRRQILHLQDKK